MSPTKPRLGALATALGTALETAREASGKSRRALAEEAGLSHVTLRELEEGLANPTLKRVEETAALYGLEVVLTVRKARK